MILKLLVGLAALVVAMITVIALQPSSFRVERSALFVASPEALFEHVNSPHKFNEWNPWAKLDAAIVNRYSGPTSGVGAKCSWTGKQAGVGSHHNTAYPTHDHRTAMIDFQPNFESLVLI
jgi:hypothetical protein